MPSVLLYVLIVIYTYTLNIFHIHTHKTMRYLSGNYVFLFAQLENNKRHKRQCLLNRSFINKNSFFIFYENWYFIPLYQNLYKTKHLYSTASTLCMYLANCKLYVNYKHEYYGCVQSNQKINETKTKKKSWTYVSKWLLINKLKSVDN